MSAARQRGRLPEGEPRVGRRQAAREPGRARRQSVAHAAHAKRRRGSRYSAHDAAHERRATREHVHHTRGHRHVQLAAGAAPQGRPAAREGARRLTFFASLLFRDLTNHSLQAKIIMPSEQDMSSSVSCNFLPKFAKIFKVLTNF